VRKIDWGQTIAILANIGVLLGIVFLAMEIRDSRIAILAQTQDSIADGFLTLNLATITEPEIGLTFQKGLCDPEELTDLEVARFSMHMRALFNQFRRIYRLYEQGLLDEQAWKLYGTEAYQFMVSPGGKWHFLVNELEPDLRVAFESFSERESNVSLVPGRNSQGLCEP
jgi:hypothetical protein